MRKTDATLQDWFDRADELGARGRYFEAHEELEVGWKAARGDEKILLQGLIQIAAGLHRLRLDPEKTEGPFYLLERGLDKLRLCRGLLSPITLMTLEASIDAVRSAGTAPAALRFGLRVATAQS